MHRTTPCIGIWITMIVGIASPWADVVFAQEKDSKPILLRFRHEKGDIGFATEAESLQLKIKTNGESFDLVSESTIKGREEVLDVEKGLPTALRKSVTEFKFIDTDTDTWKRKEIGPIADPVQLKLDFTVEPVGIDVLQGKLPEGLKDKLGKPKSFLKLIPADAVRVGEKFTPNAKSLATLRDEIAPDGAKVKTLDVSMTFERLMKIEVADGRNDERKAAGEDLVSYEFEAAEVSLSVRYEAVFGGNVPMTLLAKGRYVFVPDAGILLRFQLDGTFSIKPTEIQEDGKKVTISGEGTASGRYSYRPIDWKRGVKARGKSANDHFGASEPPRPESGGTSADLVLHRLEEPRERAFTFLAPRGWHTEGGVFNVNPLTANGPGNSIAPKCDLTVKNDARGSVLIRWVPSWNYADLTYSPNGFSTFPPGSMYQGMPVKLLPTPRAFLLELLKTMHPNATDMKVIGEDNMPELVKAYEMRSAETNRNLLAMRLRPIQTSAAALVVEYSEEGRAFREVLLTSIVDARGGAFMWSNADTLVFRAPRNEFESWKRVLDVIQTSRQLNPKWAAEVVKAMGERARDALETQRHVNDVLREIGRRRSEAQSAARYESWLFITGQEEYKNPFNGQIELGTNSYRHRWVCEDGRIIYTDNLSFDPNTIEEFKLRTWKPSPVRQR